MVIGFFMPLPLALMIPFMGIQSAVMAKQFGENFQYGKRRISAMSNEEFNKLTPAKLQANANAELKAMIPSMEQSLTDMRQFQVFVIKEFLLTVRAVIDAGLGKILGLNPSEINETVQNIEHFLHGHFEGHGATTPSPPPDEPSEVQSDKLHLSQSEISGANDLVLAAWIRNINDYTNQTQDRLLAEQKRRLRTDEPIIEPPSPAQEATKLDPNFIATLTRSDLEKGGSRVRNYKGKLQKWKGTHRISYTGKVVRPSIWKINKWVAISPNQSALTSQIADNIVNNLKRQVGSAYVLVFGSIYFLISDDF